MNKNNRSIALIIVILFLLITCSLAYATLVLFQSQHGITRSLMQLDEVRYAAEFGARHGIWVWRYHYDWLPYSVNLPVNSYNVISVDVNVNDINGDRRLDAGEIVIQINKVNWSL
ncbi:MAG: hypothetical protein ABH914_02540 [Candidatus Omnitrophota bacterium]